MSNFKGKLSFILAGIALICLISAVAIFLRQAVTAKQSEEALESMRQSAEVLTEGSSAQDVSEVSASPEQPASDASPEQPVPDAASEQADPEKASAPESQEETGTAPASIPEKNEDKPEQPAPEPSAASDTTAPDPEPGKEPAGISVEADSVPLDNPYRDSFLANADMAAWLKIDGTVIDYPVMWTPRDENYYLRRNFYGKKDTAGCLILDTDSCVDPLTTNLIIHGHNMKAGTMFGKLTKYEDPDYCKEHGILSLYTKDRRRNYEVIAVFRSQVYRKSDTVFKFYKFFQADTQEDFDDFYQNIKALSLYDTGVTAQFGDHFLTLSTCSYHVEQGRFVVVAKEIESSERYVAYRGQGNTN